MMDATALLAAGVAAFLIILNATAVAVGYVVGRLHERWSKIQNERDDLRE
jgi:DMSO/TMAO reductase YedYZ heme-binding membrane subunit